MTINTDQAEEIKAARSQSTRTLRPTVPLLEEIMYRATPLLDHGFLRVVDYMGDDDAVVQAARVSYGRGTRRVSEDAALIRYLMRHWHTTPFEMCEIKFHAKLPIFVARQWIRHRTASVNEYSGRYSVLDREFYLPEPQHLAAQSTGNRQGRGDVLGEEEAQEVLRILAEDANRTYDHYTGMLNEPGAADHDPDRTGLSRELARIGLSLSTYTQWYWKVDLHNLLGFLRLRADPHAQYEIRVYAEAMLDVVRRWVPTTYEAFLEYRLGSLSLSATATDMVRRALAGEKPNFETSGLTRREWDEVAGRLGLA
jgi:thymidylate synthase (FAD)